MTARKPKTLNLKDVKSNRRKLLEQANKKMGAGTITISEPAPLPAPGHTDLMVPPETLAPTPQSVSMAVNLALTALGQVLVTAIGQPESAPLLANVKGWAKEIEKAEKLLVDSLKPHVLANGTPWGEGGSKQLELGGMRLPLKAINPLPEDKSLIGIAHLDPKKVESLLRDQLDLNETPLSDYMRATTSYSLEGINESQAAKLKEMLDDPSWGPMLRECTKTTTYALMTPEPL